MFREKCPRASFPPIISKLMARCLREFAEFSVLKVVQLPLVALEIAARFIQ